MTVLVVYESMYGNTHMIAANIAAGLEELGDVVVASVSEADPDLVRRADLLVVGGPTHVHGMSSERTRQDAVQRLETEDKYEDLELDPDAEGPGLRDWFATLHDCKGIPAAAFDTRVGTMSALISGRASKGIHRKLRHLGFREIVEPESFGVDKDSHLMDGESERAIEWGRTLGSKLDEPVASANEPAREPDAG